MSVGLLWGYMAPFSVSSLRYKQMYAIFNFAPDLHTNVLAYSLAMVWLRQLFASLAEVLQAESPRRQISLRQTMIFTINFYSPCSRLRAAVPKSRVPHEREKAHTRREAEKTLVSSSSLRFGGETITISPTHRKMIG